MGDVVKSLAEGNCHCQRAAWGQEVFETPGYIMYEKGRNGGAARIVL